MKLSEALTLQLTRSCVTDGGIVTWMVTGPDGAATFTQPGHMIDVHRARPDYPGHELVTCRVFEDCYHDAGVGGRKIAKLHAEKGDEGLYAELEDWYRQMVADPPPPNDYPTENGTLM